MLSRLRHFGLLIALLSASSAVVGAGPGEVPRNPRFHNIGTEQGLPAPTVEAIWQDHYGYLWLGTQAGLVRYDGFRFSMYRNSPEDPHSLGSNLVTSIWEDRSHAIWVGTIGGLYRLDPGHEHFTEIVPDEAASRGGGNRTIRQLLPGFGKNVPETLWAATADGLQRIDVASGRFAFWHKRENGNTGLASDDLRALAWDADGKLWIGTDAGIDRLDPDRGDIEHFDVDANPASPRNVVSRLLFVEPATLWIGTKAGVTRWSLPEASKASPTPLPVPDTIPGDDLVRALYRDRSGAVWVGTQNNGVFRVTADLSTTHYRRHAEDPHSLADDAVVEVLQDRTGTLWIGTWYNGLSRLDLGSGGFERHTAIAGDPDTLGDNLVYHVAADAEGHLWFSTLRGGLDRLDPKSGQLRHYRHNPKDPTSLPSDWIRTAKPDAQGRVWVGTVQNGFGWLEPDSGRFHAVALDARAAEQASVRSIAIGRDDIVWVGSEFGLHRYDPARGRLSTFTHDPARPDSISQGRVLSMLVDRSNTLWLGTETGLDRMVGDDRFEHFPQEPSNPASLTRQLISDIHEDAEGRLWVGTFTGLSLLQRDADGSIRLVRQYTRQHGLADDTINAIENDADGRIWFSTDSGISRLDPANGEVRNYGTRDGLTSGGFFVHSSAALPDGTLAFGGTHGAVSFHPEAIRDNLTPPPVRITALQVSGRDVDAAKPPPGVEFSAPFELATELRLSHAISDFTLEFAALHYADPARNRYAYRLEGFDRDFIHTDASKPRATYTNLDPGRYVFHVKAANKDGVWNEQGARLVITILPPWWATWWFRAISALSLLGVLNIAYRRRVSTLKRQRAALESKVRSRTAQLAEQTRRLEESLQQVERTHREVSLLSRLSGELQASPGVAAAAQRIADYGPQLFPKSSGALYLQGQGDAGWSALGHWGDPPPDEPPSDALPLVAQGETLGLLHIDNNAASDPTEAERQRSLAITLAEQSALAIANLQLRAALFEQSIRDSLTGLYNRRHLQDMLSSEVERCRATGTPLALMMIDVDHFKNYNDSHGHAAGDAVLQLAAREVQAQLQDRGIAFRFGGEEIAALLPKADAALAMTLAQAVLESVRRVVPQFEGKTLPPVTVSIGLAQFPENGGTPQALIAAADAALYQAKGEGRDRIVRSTSVAD